MDAAHLSLELEIAQHSDRHADMFDPEVALPGAGEGDRRAHFGDDGLGELFRPLLQQLLDAGEQRKPVRNQTLRETAKSAPRRRNRQIDIRGRARRNMPDHFLRIGIGDGDPRSLRAIQPCSVDVETRVVD